MRRSGVVPSATATPTPVHNSHNAPQEGSSSTQEEPSTQVKGQKLNKYSRSLPEVRHNRDVFNPFLLSIRKREEATLKECKS